MIRAIIIDDEPLARSIIRQYLADYKTIEIVAECDDGFEGVKSINHYQPELIFLDIQMPKISGFEMLELIDQPPAVIFTTAFDAYAIKAFETHPADYLLKPFSKERFDKALKKFLQQAVPLENLKQTSSLLNEPIERPEGLERIVVKSAGKIRIIPVSDITHIEAADDYVRIHCKEGSFLKNRTMAYFENALPKNQFVRTHRSYMLNVKDITRIDPYEKDNHIALLKGGAKVPVSKTGYARLRTVLGI